MIKLLCFIFGHRWDWATYEDGYHCKRCKLNFGGVLPKGKNIKGFIHYGWQANRKRGE